MLPQELDYNFPFIVFLYGFLVLLVLEGLPALGGRSLSQHPLYDMIRQRKPLAWICFFAGGIWSLQNMWLN